MVLVDVLEEHLDEAEFRWLQWEKALGAPDFSLSEIARLEALLLAHLDGLVVGASTSVESVLRPAFATEDAFRICAAAFSLLALGEVDEVLLRFREAEPEERAAIRRVLELSEAPGLGTRLLDVLKREDTVPQAEVLEALAFRQEAPPEVLAHFFTHDEQRVRVTALRAALPMPEDAARGLLPSLLDSPHPSIRAAAMGAGLASGVRPAWETCRAAVRARDAHSLEAMVLLAMGGSETDISLLLGLLDAEQLRPHALWALGFSGRVAAMEACVAHLEVPAVAQLAGEAFSAMTGLRLEAPYALLPGERPERVLRRRRSCRRTWTRTWCPGPRTTCPGRTWPPSGAGGTRRRSASRRGRGTFSAAPSMAASWWRRWKPVPCGAAMSSPASWRCGVRAR